MTDPDPPVTDPDPPAPDPFGRAIRDHHRGDQDEPLLQREGDTSFDHPIEHFYFTDFTPDDEGSEWLASWLDGTLVDLGAGAGRHALHFQEWFETVAVERSAPLVETMRERGVEQVRHADMFALCEAFDRDRFRSALAIGTQLGLAGSMAGLRQFLCDLAHVTTPDATAVLDGYDPDLPATSELLGYRADPTPGLAHRVMHFEYEGDVGETLLFRLFSADRLREATVGTDWTVAELRHGPDEEPNQWRVALEKV